jgi:hypothetical protein
VTSALTGTPSIFGAARRCTVTPFTSASIRFVARATAASLASFVSFAARPNASWANLNCFCRTCDSPLSINNS